MIKFTRRLFNYRVLALIRKEFAQIRRDRRLAISMIVPPTLQLLLFGFALNSTVSNLRLGVLDDSRTPESRELVAVLSESRSFTLARTYISLVEDLGEAHQPRRRAGRRWSFLTISPEISSVATQPGAVPIECDGCQYRDHRAGLCRRRNGLLQRQFAESGVHAQFTPDRCARCQPRGQVTFSRPSFITRVW